MATGGGGKTVQFRPVTILLIIVGIAFMALAAYYLVTPARSLASFVPGHEAGSSHHHIKHAVAVAALAAVTWLGAWFSTNPSQDRA